MDDEITITVAARPDCGKSAVAELIRKTLEGIGTNVTLLDDNGMGIVDEQSGVIANSLDGRLDSIQKRSSKVVIQTVQKRFRPSKPEGEEMLFEVHHERGFDEWSPANPAIYNRDWFLSLDERDSSALKRGESIKVSRVMGLLIQYVRIKKY